MDRYSISIFLLRLSYIATFLSILSEVNYSVEKVVPQSDIKNIFDTSNKTETR
jgi:hypothetical protein